MPEGNELTESERAWVRTQVLKHWLVAFQAGSPYPEDLIIKLEVHLRPDGRVIKIRNAQAPSPKLNQFYQAAMREAAAAVRAAQPFNLPPEKYESWRVIYLNFRLAELMDGESYK